MGAGEEVRHQAQEGKAQERRRAQEGQPGEEIPRQDREGRGGRRRHQRRDGEPPADAVGPGDEHLREPFLGDPRRTGEAVGKGIGSGKAARRQDLLAEVEMPMAVGIVQKLRRRQKEQGVAADGHGHDKQGSLCGLRCRRSNGHGRMRL